MHYYIKVYNVFFSCFHNYVSKNVHVLISHFQSLIFESITGIELTVTSFFIKNLE